MAYKKERIKYIDALKFIAIFSIIALHMFSTWKNAQILGFDIYNFSELTRFGVTLFLLISGALLLNKDIEIKSFLKKRLVRIILPLIFYIIISILLGVYHTVLQPYWYAWMIIGAYLTIPIINIFIKNAKMKEIEYFLIIFLIATLTYQLTIYFNINHCLDLTSFIGPVSFMILGYYLSKKEFKISNNKMIIISIILFIISTLFKMKFGDYFNFNTGNLSSHLCISFLQIIQTSAVFLIFRYLYETKDNIFSYIRKFLEINIINKFILSVSRASYGMYLFHMIIFRGLIKEFMKNLNLNGTQVCISIIILTIVLFLVSWLGVLILGQIPYIKKLSGYY